MKKKIDTRCLSIEEGKHFLRCHLKDPSGFKRFRSKRISRGLVLLVGHRKGAQKTEAVSLLFSKRYFHR